MCFLQYIWKKAWKNISQRTLLKQIFLRKRNLHPKQEIVQPSPVVVSQNQPDMTLSNFIHLWRCHGFKQGAVLHDLHLAAFQLNDSVVTLHVYSKTCQLASFQSI